MSVYYINPINNMNYFYLNKYLLFNRPQNHISSNYRQDQIIRPIPLRPETKDFEMYPISNKNIHV